MSTAPAATPPEGAPPEGTPPATPPAGAPPATPPTPPAEPPAGENPLLDELKRERRDRKALETRLAQLETAAEEARRQALPEQDRLLEEARAEARAEALSGVRVTLASAKVHAAAAGLGFQDPADAAAHLDLASLDPDKDDEVLALVKGLAERKPYLLGRAKPVVPPVPGGPQGDGAAKQSFNDFLRSAVRGS